MKAAEAQEILDRLSEATPEERRNVGLYSRRTLRYDTTQLRRMAGTAAFFAEQKPDWFESAEHQAAIEHICGIIDGRMIPNAEVCRRLWPDLEPAWTDAISTLANVREAFKTGERPRLPEPEAA